MIQALLAQLPQLLAQMLPFLPPIVRNLIQTEIHKKIERTTPEQLQALNALIDRYLDAVGRRDFEDIGRMFEQYHVQPGGTVEQITARLMGLGFMPPLEPGYKPDYDYLNSPAGMENAGLPIGYDHASPHD